MHHFLYERARVHHGLDDRSSPALASAVDDTVGYASLTPANRAAWDDAVLYYDTAFVTHRLDFDSGRLIAANYALADNEAASSVKPSKGLPPALASVLNSAVTAYRQVWWPRHDSANLRWITSILPLFHKHGSRLASQLEHIYEVSWPGSPVRAEVVAYANWAGAYTTRDPTLVTMSSTYRGNQGSLGIEMLFHEPEHAMLDSVDAALITSGLNPRSQSGATLEHAIIFYTAGELTRREIPSHNTYASVRRLWDPGGYLSGLYNPLASAWLARINDESSLRAAIAALVADLPNGHN